MDGEISVRERSVVRFFRALADCFLFARITNGFNGVDTVKSVSSRVVSRSIFLFFDGFYRDNSVFRTYTYVCVRIERY